MECKGLYDCIIHPELKCKQLELKIVRGIPNCLYCNLNNCVLGTYTQIV